MTFDLDGSVSHICGREGDKSRAKKIIIVVNGQDNDTATVVRDFKDIEFSLGRRFSSTRPDILIEGLRKYDPDGDEYAFSYAWIIIVRGIS